MMRGKAQIVVNHFQNVFTRESSSLEKVRDYGFWVELHTLMNTSVNQDDKPINDDLKPYAQVAIL